MCAVLNARHLNIGGLSFLLADPNQHSTAIFHSILRGFGAKRVIEVRNIRDAIQVLTDQKIDMMLIEPRLPDGGAFASFTRSGKTRAIRAAPCRFWSSPGMLGFLRSKARVTAAPTWSSPNRFPRPSYTNDWPGSRFSSPQIRRYRQVFRPGSALRKRRLRRWRRPADRRRYGRSRRGSCSLADRDRQSRPECPGGRSGMNTKSFSAGWNWQTR